jgi:hypothetical protein
MTLTGTTLEEIDCFIQSALARQSSKLFQRPIAKLGIEFFGYSRILMGLRGRLLLKG